MGKKQTYRYRVLAGPHICFGVQLAPFFQEVAHKLLIIVDQTEPSDIDGSILDDLALPTVIHDLGIE